MENKRIYSIDVFRGLTIFIMILGNLSPDGSFTYPTLIHSGWTGVNLIDIVFPAFIFIMGVSTVFTRSLDNAGWRNKVIRRAALLFILGLLVNHLPLLFTALCSHDYTLGQAGNDFLTCFRPFGVLQRIALVYLLGTLLFRRTARSWSLLAIACMLLLVSSLGYHLYNPAAPFSEQNNISLYIDQQLQGINHNYIQAPYDPEGLYGTLNATATMLLGCWAGLSLKSRQSLHPTAKGPLKKLFALGLMLILAAWGWSHWEIISKPLWTAPYVLLISGLGMIMLSTAEKIAHNPLLRFLFHPLKAMGRNPIFIYLLAEWGLALLYAIPHNGEPLYLWLYHSHAFNPTSPFTSTFTYTMLWNIALLIVAEIMYVKGIIVKI